MNKIKIVADSLCDISAEYAKEHDIDIVPLSIIFGEESYKDGVDLSKKQFYEKLTTGKVMPKTSQVNPAEFEEAFSRYPDREILYIGASSKASGTYQSGVIAKEMREREDIHTFDTMALSMGAGLMVAEAAKMAEMGSGIAEILSQLEHMKVKMQTIFTVDTLEFLERGGRISKAKSVIGTMLSIKPILTVEGGLVVPMDSVRGRKKVNDKVLSLIRRDKEHFKGETIGLVHADNPEDARELKELIISEFSPAEIIEGEIGAGVGTHCGPGTVALFYVR
ncbi:MAG: DegV family protein [Peptostreptococcaceae bacterium]|nr:DegV family protein [Peptostreptococcaceae bacterium]